MESGLLRHCPIALAIGKFKYFHSVYCCLGGRKHLQLKLLEILYYHSRKRAAFGHEEIGQITTPCILCLMQVTICESKTSLW